MKLNPDCMRDILFRMEEIPYGEDLDISDLITSLPDYSTDDIQYSAKKLKEAGYITADIKEWITGEAVLRVCDITYTGHQFLADIKSDTVWTQVKDVSKKVGSNSLNILSQIAASILTTLIQQNL